MRIVLTTFLALLLSAQATLAHPERPVCTRADGSIVKTAEHDCMLMDEVVPGRELQRVFPGEQIIGILRLPDDPQATLWINRDTHYGEGDFTPWSEFSGRKVTRGPGSEDDRDQSGSREGSDTESPSDDAPADDGDDDSGGGDDDGADDGADNPACKE